MKQGYYWIIALLIIFGIMFSCMKFASENTLMSNLEIQLLHNEIENLQNRIILQNKRLIELNKEFSLTVEATAYTPRKEECNDDWMNTATMKKPKPGSHIAVSQDLKWMLGKKVYVEGLGIKFVEDLMNKRFSKRIDIMMNSVKKAQTFGLQTLEVVVLNN